LGEGSHAGSNDRPVKEGAPAEQALPADQRIRNA
jgi:hypothetical protein